MAVQLFFFTRGQLLSVLMTVRNHVGVIVIPESTCTVSKTDSKIFTWDKVLWAEGGRPFICCVVELSKYCITISRC